MTWDIAKTAEYYDAIASSYDERGYSLSGGDYPANHFRLEMAKKILADLPKGRLLDGGCGTGLFLAHAAAEGFDCVGSDFSIGMLDQARSNLPAQAADRVRLVQAPLHDLGEMEDASFDAVFCLGVFPYVPENLEAPSYREMRRLIRSGGTFVTAHQNELFDLLTFNKYTLRFFERNVFPLLEKHGANVDLSAARDELRSLITHPDEPVNTDAGRSGRDIIFTRPENPLTFGEKLASFGFAAKDTLYYHFHSVPPLVRNGSDTLLDASKRLELSEARSWQGMFIASTFVSIAEAVS